MFFGNNQQKKKKSKRNETKQERERERETNEIKQSAVGLFYSRVPRVVILRETELRGEVVGDLLQSLAASLGDAEVVEEH